MFNLKAPYSPMGDQPEAIEALSDGIEKGLREQVLLGVTGSGKTFTMANIIARVNRPTLVLAHNKTLAAQLCSEFRELFPDNAVEYFVSYYDYYQPEAYIPGKDIYIEKDALINDEIDKLRHSATSALFERRDVIIVSSVSCIYSLGDPEDYRSLMIGLRPGMEMGRDALLRSLISIKYTRNDISFERNCFRVMGDTVDVYPSSSDGKIIRVEFFGDEIDRLSELDKLTGEYLRELRFASIFPATHYATTDEKRERAIAEIRAELAERVKYFEDQGKLVEAQRIAERTNYDLEMINEIGYCSGVENYSRVFSGRPVGSTPYTLLDYFPKDYLLFIDESHATIPQVRGMSGGDRARKENLVNYGFRLPSAFDNRPLFFDEFRQRINQVVYVSATPAEYELGRAQRIAEQLIRPTGLVDPEIEVRPIAGQVDDVMGEIRERAKKDQRVLVTTLTTKMAEDLTDYLSSNGIRVRYLHHRIETVERMEIIRDLRAGIFDVLVGINLLREGLDIPEVSLVAILDADKEGLFRSATSLIQTVGRAARNAEGKVIMYADSVTKSMDVAITETNRRREKQLAFNRENGIVPKTIVKEIRDPIDIGLPAKSSKDGRKRVFTPSERDGIPEIIERLTKQMRAAAKALEFERAAYLRDTIEELKKEMKNTDGSTS
ncbi:MAG: excinuclease ABC subunit UvrB [Clostridia bacterium]|nr:excinuclease ABC subunit UvrB [Clostridia bacterium]